MKITEILYNARTKLYTLLLDQKESLVLYEDTLVKYELKKGQELTDEEWEELKHFNTVAAAVQYVCVYLLTTPRTEKNIKDKLRQKGYEKNVVDEAMSHLNSLGYIQDSLYAEAFIEGNIQRKSPRAIRQKLMEKGVSPEHADAAFAKFDTDEHQAEQIKVLALKKMKSMKALPEREMRDKIIRHLLYKGYAYEDCKGVVSALLGSSGEAEEFES